MASMTENLIFARNLQKILTLADFSPHCSIAAKRKTARASLQGPFQ
jgi:hypothetical protein